ncbi:hypothetical protein ACFX5D_04050 [Flavobacterium sp. LB3P45]|uniref:Uncharacterized protein n=1 Tax=Flavobacterium fructosi TaxID=3230416 RepID=A0ABW6HJD3_9FLAO
MAIQKTLKFIKDSTGIVLLYNTQNNSLVASFNPAQSMVRENEDPYRFRIVSSLALDREGFLLDYRTINTVLCVPLIVEANINDFLAELSRKFFFLENKEKHRPYAEGELCIFKRNGNPNKLILEVNDFVMGMVEGIFIEGTYLGGNSALLVSFDIVERKEF